MRSTAAKSSSANNSDLDISRLLQYNCTSLVSMATPTDSKLLKQTKFPPEFNKKVDVRKVNIEVMKK